MAAPPWTTPTKFLIATAVMLSVPSCTVIDAPGTSMGPVATPHFEVLEEDDAYDCPRQVPANECVSLTQAERTSLWWDVQVGVKWEIQACKDVGLAIQDFVLYGNVRKWPDQRYPYWNGAYRHPSLIRTARVSLNDKLFGQGWTTERTRTTMHEGFHHAGYDDEYAAAAFEDYCVNN